MSNEMLRNIVSFFLVVHGIGHVGGYWFFVKSWLSPSLAEQPLRWVFVGLWLIAFVAYAAAGFMVFQQQGAWRILAIGASVLSLAVSILFVQGPSLNAAAADVIILIALLAFGWPSPEVVGS